MEINEGNKLIAEFMGFTPRTDLHTKGALFMQSPIESPATHSACYIVDKSLDEFDEFLELQYHSSWDWLMPVVEKINNLFSEKGSELSNHSRDQEHLVNPLDNPNHWKSWSYHYIHLSTNIKRVYESVVNSLQWYNTTLTPK